MKKIFTIIASITLFIGLVVAQPDGGIKGSGGDIGGVGGAGGKGDDGKGDEGENDTLILSKTLDFSVCAGECFDITATYQGDSVIDDGDYYYSWSHSTEEKQTVNFCPVDNQTQVQCELYLRDSDKGDKLIATSITITVTLNALPSLSAPLVDQEVCQDSCVQLSASTGANYGYSWSAPTGLSSATISDPMACIDTSNVMYIVTISDTTTQCSINDTVMLTAKQCGSSSVTSIIEQNQLSVSLFPNPVFDNLKINLTNNMQLNSFFITDITGQVVKEQHQDINTVRKLDVSNLRTGIYLIHLETSQGQFVRKFTKN